MAAGQHPGSCANATRHQCRCSGCGGSQHGWAGWVGLATGAGQDRDTRRRSVERSWTGSRGSGGRPTPARREAGVDLARLDVADWLAEQGGPPTAGGRPSAVDLVILLAGSLTSQTWPDIERDLRDRGADQRAVRLQLARHFWCDLLLGLVRVVESADDVLRTMPIAAKALVREVLRDSSVDAGRPGVTGAVVNVVLDRVWAGLVGAALGGRPLLAVVGAEDTARALRILALFLCPSPARHREVREHALKPLGDDVSEILTDPTKDRLATLFEEWLP